MGTIHIKFSKEDTVYHGSAIHTKVYADCPDCQGTKLWHVRFEDGEEIEVACQTCRRGYITTGTIESYVWSPDVRQLTIGDVGFEDGAGRYMCYETGVGSGRIYYDHELFDTRPEAQMRAQAETDRQLAHQAEKNFYRKGLRKADKYENMLSTEGYSRANALSHSRALRRWVDMVQGSEVSK